MNVFLSLIISTLISFSLIGRIPIFWVSLVFVYLPVTGIFIRKIFDQKFSRYLVLDKLTGFYSFKPDTPKIYKWYSNALDISLGMLVGFSIAYFFNGGWTK